MLPKLYRTSNLLRFLCRNHTTSTKSLIIDQKPLHIRTTTKLFKGTYNNESVIVKTASSPSKQSSIQKEHLIHQNISSHSNIIPLLNNQDNNIEHLIFPYLENGSIESSMHHLRKTTTTTDRMKLLIKITSALSNLETQDQMLHRDLKASNILLDATHTIPYLSDFGISITKQSNDDEYIPIHGSVHHMAPELLIAKLSTCGMAPYRTSQEMYSFGILAYEILEMKTPYLGVVGGLPGTITRTELQRKIIEESYRPKWSISTKTTKNTKNKDEERDALLKQKAIQLIEMCWSQKETDRPKSFVAVHQELKELVLNAQSGSIHVPTSIDSSIDIGGRKEMEDTMVIMEKKSASFNYHVIGVFDGHNGDHVAVRAKEIIREIMSSSSSKQFFSSSDILMQHIFQTLTDEFSISKQAMTTGATATIGIIHRTFDTSMIEIHVGWVGDSTAVLLNLNNEKEKNIIFQTRNHSPGDPLEKERIEKEGGVVNRLKKMRDDGIEMSYGPNRVYGSDGKAGGLAVSRALGDRKWYPYVSSQHETMSFSIEEDASQNIVLICATDGLWDVTTEKDLIDVITTVDKSKATVADALVRRAVDEKKTQDNCAVVVVNV